MGAGSSFFESFGGMPGRTGRGFGVSSMQPRKAPPIQSDLKCTLEELYSGTTKKMKISRNIIQNNTQVIKFLNLIFFKK